MYYGTIAPWEHYPKNLCFNEIQHPLQVVKAFFDFSEPQEHRKQLKQWRYYVINYGYYNDERFGPGTLLYIYDLNVKLLEALHLLLWEYKYNAQKPEPITNEQLKNEQEQWPYFPQNLSEEELSNPYIALNKCFKKMKPQQYRDELHQWLHIALNNHTADERLTTSDIIMVYKNMLRLYSAAWLIHQRGVEEESTV